MSVSLAIAIYIVIWWTVLFAVLPIGVRTQGEDGAIVPGTPESAPTRAAPAARRAAHHGRSSTLLFALPWAVMRYGLVDLGALARAADRLIPRSASEQRRKRKEQGQRPCSENFHVCLVNANAHIRQALVAEFHPQTWAPKPCTTSGL